MRILILTMALTLICSIQAGAHEYDRRGYGSTCEILGTKQDFYNQPKQLPKRLYVRFSGTVIDGRFFEAKNSDFTRTRDEAFEKLNHIQKFPPSGSRPTVVTTDAEYIGSDATLSLKAELTWLGYNGVAMEWRNVFDTALLSSILTLLGEKSHPDFVKAPPTLTTLQHSTKSFGWFDLDGVSALLAQPQYDAYQLHYSEQEFDGLSYHIYIQCNI